MALLCGGCVTQPQGPPMAYYRVNGEPVDPAGLDMATTQCKGDAYQAAANTPGAAYPNIYLVASAKKNQDDTRAAVMLACMSRAGYIYR